MNVIQMRDLIDFYNDRYKSPRFADSNYSAAINAAIIYLFKDKTDNKKLFRKYSFQSNEQVRRELYSLIKTVTIVPTGDVVVYPADFDYLGDLMVTINGAVQYVKPTNFNEIGPLQQDPFRKPSVTKPYYIENNVGLVVYYGGSGSFSSSSLTYLKKPNTVSMGIETDKISPGANVLTNGTSYVAYTDAVQNGVLRPSGTQFTATGTSLTSGTVIPFSILVNCDLPESVHDEICKVSSEIMNGTIEDYNKANFMQREVEKQ